MVNLPVELHLLIFDLLPTYELIKCRQICNLWNIIIDNNLHIFNIDVSNTNITNNALKLFKNAKKINLTNCLKITNKGLDYLTNIENISLNGCFNISAKGLKKIKNVKILDVSWCNINSKDLLHLSNPDTVIVSLDIENKILKKYPNTHFIYDTHYLMQFDYSSQSEYSEYSDDTRSYSDNEPSFNIADEF